jgi:hypothetical protein
MSSLRIRVVPALCVPVFALAGCYVVPIAPDGQPYAVVPAPAVLPSAAPPAATPLVARLYPDNDLATQTGVLTGSVTNFMTGKGQFQLNYGGEILTGEATRVNGDLRQGIASAYGSRGTYMNCQYRMTSPVLGTGTCHVSNGARYRVHLGG